MCSVVVVLPASMCAMTPMLRILLRSIDLAAAAIGVTSKSRGLTTETQRHREDTKRDKEGTGRFGAAERLLAHSLFFPLFCLLCVSVSLWLVPVFLRLPGEVREGLVGLGHLDGVFAL